jgi:hypothetical protein
MNGTDPVRRRIFFYMETDFGRSGFWRKRERIENSHDALEDKGSCSPAKPNSTLSLT